MQVSWPFILITSIIGSSALSALITFFATSKLKGIDFKYDYKKYVLQKRQDAYNEIEQLLVRLGKKVIKRQTSQRIHTIFLNSKSDNDPLWEFMAEITNVLDKHRFWISKQIDDELINLLSFINNYSKGFPQGSSITLSQLEILGINNFEQIENFRIRLCNQFFNDIKELDDIEKFKKSKKHF